jgi:hypothetical protein
MSAIDEVIARSRQPGGFTEHKRFTLARSRGIQKMRQFALADPHYYVLELIQSAVANGASYIDIQVDRTTMGLSYVGGGYHESQLAQLFDFLFASREDVEHGDLRLLALGVNALMLFEPGEIVIESGDGTLKGTTRVVIKGREDVVDVGTPERALRGTFIRATGLDRRKIRGRSNMQPHELGPPECRAIEERCITAPVPILVNNHPLFGYSSQRTPPSIFGLHPTQVFDEGDFYGTIGVATRASGAVFRLVTHGVWIQSVTHDRASNIGGIISFDRLRKTADHAGIVQDERYDEMWLRLKPYVYQLQTGGKGARASDIGLLDGPRLETHEIIAVIRQAGGGVFVPVATRTGTYTRERAHVIGQALGLPVVFSPEQDMATLMEVAGSKAMSIQPDLTSEQDLLFYQQGEAQPPARPWLLEPMELAELPMADIRSWILAEARVRPSGPRLSDTSEDSAIGRLLRERLPPSTSAAVTIYTPSEMGGHEQELRVEIRTARRLLWSGWLETAYPGHVLVIDMPTMSPGVLRRPLVTGGDSLAELIAQAVVRHAADHFESASRRSLQEFIHREVRPGTVAARMILAALARQTIKRLRTDEDGACHVLFSSVDRAVDPRLWDVPVLQTLSGRPVSLRALSELLDATMGFVYGTVPEVEPDLEGLNLDRILELDLHLERMVIALVGEGAYIRVDRREVLADYHGAKCRDIALGLRDYDDFPMLVEGARPSMWALEEQRLCLEALVAQLIAVLTQPPGLDPGRREDRRQALRHLRWLSIWQLRYESPVPIRDLSQLPLFCCVDGSLCTARQIFDVLASGGRLRMLDGRSDDLTRYDGPALARLFGEAGSVALEAVDLAMNPFVFYLLGALGRVEASADFALHPAEASAIGRAEAQVFLETAPVDEPGIEGMLGLPLNPPDQPAVVVIGRDRSQVYVVDETARMHGIVGVIRLNRETVEPDAIEDAIRQAAQRLLHDLTTDFAVNHTKMAPEVYDRVVECLFGYAARNISLTLQPRGAVALDVWQGLAQRILDLPVFPGSAGTPLSAHRLIREFQIDMALAIKEGTEAEAWQTPALGSGVPPVLARWLERTLIASNVHGLACRGGVIREIPRRDEAASSGVEALSEDLTRWLTALRPDLEDEADDTRHTRSFGVVIEPSWANEVSLATFRRNANHQTYLSVNVDHWLVGWAMDTGAVEARAWLLLGLYALINERLVHVTNAHELLFQKRVAQAVQNGGFAL